MTDNLPVRTVLPELRQALASGRYAVLQAPPGAGKTTLVPLALLDEPWLLGMSILLLEPRRLAARASAARMADMLRESVGETVGYQVRMDRKITRNTRIEVVTEGILTRRIQQDPSLEGVGLVIFDEFHERSLNSDLGLALCLEAADALRPDLRVLVMSATMDTGGVAALMGNAPVIRSQGRAYPVETIYLPPVGQTNDRGAFDRHCFRAVAKAMAEHPGDILVFLPGVGEIRRLEALLSDGGGVDATVTPLYATLSATAQASAILPSRPGERKVVLATSVAETSLTIQGVRVVIDSGLMRVPRFFSGTGMTRLDTVAVSTASADQRRGRAGRVEAGVCYRLWPEQANASLNPFTPPEILSTDLAGFVLELAVWGVRDPGTLKFLDLPPEGALTQARELLTAMDALDGNGQVTSHGRRLAAAGIHPRLAHMIIRGDDVGLGTMACQMAALLSERDFLLFPPGESDPDIRLRLEILEAMGMGNSGHASGFTINRSRALGILRTSDILGNRLAIKRTPMDIDRAGFLLALAYPERVARKRDNRAGTFLMASGTGAALPEASALGLNTWIVAAHLDGRPGNARIFLGAGYSEQELEQDFGHRFTTRDILEWDRTTAAVKARTRTSYGSIQIREQALEPMDPDMACDAMITGIRQMGLASLPWTASLESLRERVIFLREHGGRASLPDLSDRALERDMEFWLKPFLTGILSGSQLKLVDLDAALSTLVPWKKKQEIEALAPTHLTVPSGSRIALRYCADGRPLASPVLAVRLQEMFGLTSTPAIAGGRIPITLHLLSPAGRPVQITQDLESFWRNTYPEVKKDLMGRYPKHFWPDDPLCAAPTARTKKRR